MMERLWDRDKGKRFDDDGGPYMRPDYISLSMLGNHGAVLVNVKDCKFSHH